MRLKHFIVIIILFFNLIFLSGCYDANSVETLAYAVAIGIDCVEESVIKLTMQFAVPKTSDQSSSSSQASTSNIIDVNCSTIDEGISLINSYISKKINLSHCKAIVFSEELAYNGLSDYILNLMNNAQVRPDCNIIISRCDAYYFLSNSVPTLESVPARYYELILNSTEYTGYTDSVYLTDFYERLLNNRCEPIAILGGVNTKNTQDAASSKSALGNAYKADETPLEAQNNIENMGLAVFSKDSLVGELNSIETLCHMIVSNKLKSATITIPNPNDSNKNISIDIYLKKSTKRNVKIINDYPYITINVWITGRALNINESIDLTNEKDVQVLNDAVSAYIKYCIYSYLYKTSKDFNTDIDDFSVDLINRYLTISDWEKADWLNNYENAFFKVNVYSNIISSNLFNNF